MTHFLGLTSIVTTTDYLLTTPRRLAEALRKMVDVQLLEAPVQIPTS